MRQSPRERSHVARPGIHSQDPYTWRAQGGVTAARRILVVEDEMFVAMDIELVVIKVGHQVVGFAGTAERAVALADETRPDLILMDIRLAGARDSIDAAIEIRQSFDIPSLIISAWSDAQTRERAKPARTLGFIPKPFDHTVLAIALNGGLKP